MSFKYKLNKYYIAYGQEFIIEPPTYNEIINEFYLNDNLNNLITINKSNGTIYVSSLINVGVYDIIINDNNKLQIIIKPNVMYKISSFYNDSNYQSYYPIINPSHVSSDIDYFMFDNEYNNIYIDKKTGRITFDKNIIANSFNLIINFSIKNIKQTCITTFNILPLISYSETKYYCNKYDDFKSVIPQIYPLGGKFKFLNDYSGILLNNQGEIITNKPKSGSYKLIINYQVNSVSSNCNIELNVIPTIIYEKNIINVNELCELKQPENSDIGGVFKLEKNDITNKLSINQSTGKITIIEILPSGHYFIKVLYSYNNLITENYCEIYITPIIIYLNNNIEVEYGTKYNSEIPQSPEIIDGIFTLVNNYENIFINPKNGILYFNNLINVGNYIIEILYNKNNINKIFNFYYKVKPLIKIIDKINDQEINYYQELTNIKLETLPLGGTITNNFNIPIENNIILLNQIDKKINSYELQLKYSYNNITSIINYKFKIIPFIVYNTNSINLTFKQDFDSELPSVYPYDGKFSLLTKNKFILINTQTGILSIKSGLGVGIYSLIINYEYNGLVNSTNYTIKIKPTFNIINNSSTYYHNPKPTFLYNLDPIEVYPSGGIFESSLFPICNKGIISIPSDLDIGDYTINIKYIYNQIENDFEYYLKVMPHNLKCLFKQIDKVYDGTTDVKLCYVNPLSNNLKLTFDANFKDKQVGFNKTIDITNINTSNKNIIHNDTFIIGHIKSKILDIVFEGVYKIYDGNKIAEIKYIFTNQILDDDVFIESYNALFENYTVGTSKILINNIKLGGKDAFNYVCYKTYETNGIILPKEIFVVFKNPTVVYNNTNNIKLEIESISGIINNDIVIIDSYNINFESTEVGTNIPVNITNIHLFKNNNYYVNPIKIFGTIIHKQIDIDIECLDKIYDGNTDAMVKINSPLTEILSYNTYYENKNVGKKKVFITNIIPKNINYVIKDKIINGVILPLNLRINFNGYDKVYDGTNNINGEITFLNKIENDDINIDIAFKTKVSHVEEFKVIYGTLPKLYGTDSQNYKIGNITFNSPSVTRLKVDVEFIGIDKIYDSNTLANVRVKNISGKVFTDNIKIKSYTARYENKDAGINKKIVIENIVFANDNGNYYCDSSYTFANIEKRPLIITSEGVNKEYDGTLNAEIKITNITGICFNDNVYITNYLAEYNDPNVGTNKKINIKNIEFGGIDKDNYICNDFTLCANIIKKQLTFKINNIEKYYDGTPNINLKLEINDTISGDIINIVSYESFFNNSSIGTNKKINVKKIKLEGTSLSNYYYESIDNIYGNIYPSVANINFIVNDKIFDGTTNANVNTDYTYNINYEAYYDDINVGQNKKITIKVINNDTTSNYLLNDTYIVYGNILPKEIKFNYYLKDKVFNSDINHYINFNTMTDLDATIEVLNYTAYFENCNVGNRKLFIDNLELNNSNYYSNGFMLYGTIIPKCTDVQFIPQSKTFDETNNVVIENIINPHSFSILSYDARFIDYNVGMQKVIVTNITTNNKNYKVNDYITEAFIYPSPANLLVEIKTKEYDGTTDCQIQKYNYEIENGDYYFENEFVGNNKKVIFKNIVLKNKNYICLDTYFTGNIVKKNICINFKDNNKEYDGTTNTKLEINYLDGIINDELVKVKSFNSYYNSIGVGKTILYISDVKLFGIHANNYVVNDFFICANINKKKLSYIFNVIDFIDESSTYISINITITNIINNDEVYIESYSSEKDTITKTIKITNIILEGKDKENYYIEDLVTNYYS